MKPSYKKFTTYGMLLSTMSGVALSVATAPVANAQIPTQASSQGEQATTTPTVATKDNGQVTTPLVKTNDKVDLDNVIITPDMTEDEFIAAIGPVAQKLGDEYGIYASVMIAQAIIESGWGKSGLAQHPNNNLFGIKGAYEGQSVTMNTREEVNGGSTYVDAAFRKYPSASESLRDNAELISTSLYSGAWRVNAPTYQDATASLTGVYATDSNYDKTLNATIEKYGLTVYDAPYTGEKTTPKNKVEPDYKLKKQEVVTPVEYEVKEKDSLWGVAREHEVSIDQIEKWNENIKDKDLSEAVGEKIKVAEDKKEEEVAYKEVTETNDKIHKVQPGEYLSKIAEDEGLSLEELLELNPDITVDTVLHIGDELKVGEETKTYDKVLTDEERKQADKEAEDKARALDRAEEQAKRQAQSTDGAGQVVSVNYNTSGNATGTINTDNLDKDVKAVIDFAAQQIGKPYVWGARGPDSFDCSGLMQYVFKNTMGVDIGSWTVPQESAGTHISVSQAQPGDLLFWGAAGGTYHVALYIGNGEYIHAPQPGENVKVGKIAYFAPDFAVKVFNN